MSKYFLVGNSHLSQFKSIEEESTFKIKLLGGAGASIRGLLNPNSLTGLNQQVKQHDIDISTCFIFHLGQVDIEFGYYYKCALANTKLDIHTFIADTIDIYTRYLKTIQGKIIIIGINPTAITDMSHTFYVNFKDTVCHQNNKVQQVGEFQTDRTYASLAHIYNDSIDIRNQSLLFMNNALDKMCAANGWKFIDMMPIVSINGQLAPQFQPTRLDHHLIPSLELSTYVLSQL